MRQFLFFILGVLSLYGLGSFIALSFSPSRWSFLGRLCLAVIIVVYAVAVFLPPDGSAPAEDEQHDDYDGYGDMNT